MQKKVLAILIFMFLAGCSPREVSRPANHGQEVFAPPVTPQVSGASISIDLEKVAGGFNLPTYLTHAGDERLFVVEQPGTIRIIQEGQVLLESFLDIRDLVSTAGSERGLLSMVFEEKPAGDARFYVNYTHTPDGATVVARYRVAEDRNLADADSGEILIVIEQPEPNHNGGGMVLGPDGYLYIGTGDGGGAGDRHGRSGNAQDLSTLLGKMLRIDISGERGYSVPDDNPFLGDSGARPEIWAYGLRNPWRFSFDRLTGDLFIADVGQNLLEEVNYVSAGSAGGENYGWRIMEASACYNPSSGCDASGLVLPVAEYGRSDGCSVTGGYVYRGPSFSQLDGWYFFGDYCTGKIWAMERTAEPGWQVYELLAGVGRISSFGEDVNGELYVVSHGGDIFRITAP